MPFLIDDYVEFFLPRDFSKFIRTRMGTFFHGFSSFSKISIGLLLLIAINALPAYSQGSGTIKGKITEDNTDQPVEFANILLQKAKGKQERVQGTTTNAKGRFQLTNLDWGKYELICSYMGYKTQKVETIQLSEEQPVVKLDTLSMKSNAQNLDEVSIQEERDFINQTATGITVNPDKNITQTGGSAIDILQNTPTVNVTFDEAIKMRGTEAGATQVLINGRESALSDNVAQIPASAVESIEVIQNPGAEYQAEGKGGVINIILKKQTQKGTNGKVDFSAGSRDQYNAGLQLNHGTDNFNFFLNFNRRHDVDIESESSRRDVFSQDTTVSRIVDGNDKEVETSNTIRGGAEYFWNYFNKIGIDLVYENESERATSRTMNTLKRTKPDEELMRKREITDNIDENGYTYEPTIYYERKFPEAGKKLKASVKYAYEFQNDVTTTEKQPIATNGNEPYQNRQRTKDNRQLGVFRVDYTDPIMDSGKLETGLRGQYRQFDNDYSYLEYNPNTTEWVDQRSISNDFLYQEQVYAGYLQGSYEYNKWKAIAGIRAEQTMINTEVKDTDNDNENEYLNFFPSARLQYQMNEDRSLNLSYSRRIDRPSAWRLNPFPDLSDSSSIFIGNPNINPEYINSFELTYADKWQDIDINATAFYRQREGVIDYLTVIRDGLPYIRPQNLASGETFGLETTLTTWIAPFWRLNINGAVYQSRIRGQIGNFEGVQNAGENISNENTTYRAKLNTSFKLPHNFRLQLTGNFDGPEVEALEEEKARYFMNAGLQKSLFDGDGSIGINVRDIFDTRRMKEIGNNENFSEIRTRERLAQTFMVSFSYKI